MEFYLEQAKKQLLASFEPAIIEDDARSYAEHHLHAIGRHFDSEQHDIADFADALCRRSLNDSLLSADQHAVIVVSTS